MLRPGRLLLACAALCALTAPAAAGDWPVPRGPSREPAPYRYDPAQWKKVPRAYLEDAPACVLYSASSYHVEADGTVEMTVHDVTRLNSRKSIEKLGEYRNITFNPAFEKLTLNEARIHKPAGKSVAVEPRHAHLRDVGTDYQVYDPEKQLVLSFPSLEVGDVIEVRWTVRGKNPEYQGQFFTRYTFGSDDYPVVRDELRVRLPAGRTLKHAATGGKAEPAVTEAGGFRLYRWAADNVQQAAREEDRPPKEDLTLQVAVSTFGSWDEVAAWKRKLRADCWESTGQVKKVVADVTRGLDTPEEKARALTYWVRRNVRYVSAGLKHDYTPYKPADVLANRRGDCKDTSQLLAVLLREAGVPSSLVTLGVRDDGQVLEGVPSPWGTHAILLVTLGGKDHWIDTTASMAGWDFLPRPCRDRLCYVFDGKAVRLKRTPTLTADENRYEQTTRVSIAADGTSRQHRTAVHHGLAAYNQRDRWLEVPAGEQRRLVTQRLQDNNSQARLARLDIDEAALANFDLPVRAEITFTIPGHFAGKDRDGSFSDGKVWNYLLGYTLDYDRKVPLELTAPVESTHRFQVTAPPGSEFDGTPKDKTIRSKWGVFSRTSKFVDDDPRRVQVDFRLRLDKVRVEPRDFDDFRAFHRDVNDAYRAWLTLERVWDLAHAPELEVILALAPEDSDAAAVLARLYLHHDRRDDARRVLARARHYRPDEVVLWELSVKAAASRAGAEKLQRQLVRRFPDDPVQSIALAAMFIDRGRHGLAEPLLRELVKDAPPAARGLAAYQLARSRFAQGKAEEALKLLDEAANADGKDNTVAQEMLRGRACAKLDRPEDALRAYEKAAKADPKADEPLVALVELSLGRKDVPRAVRYLRQYAVLVGDDSDGLVRAADFALRLGRLDEAFDLASRAREQRFHEGAQRVLGLVHLRRGEFEKALFHLERADPTAAVLAGRIAAHLELGNLAAAEREAARADSVRQPPQDLKEARERVRTLVARREALLEQAGATPANRNKWTTAVDYFVCAEEARRRGRPAARVEALLAKAGGGGCELGAVHALRGLLDLERGRLRQASAEADKAVTLSPREARGWYVRGRARLERAAGGALSDLQKAAELGGRRDADVLRFLAEAQYQAGQAGQARQTLREAIKLRPGDKELAALLDQWQRTGARRP